MKKLTLIIALTITTFAHAGELTKEEAYEYVRQTLAKNMYLNSMPAHDQMLARKWAILQVIKSVNKMASEDGSIADIETESILKIAQMIA
jgi:hypothetical protein